MGYWTKQQQCTGYWTKQHQCTGYWMKKHQCTCYWTKQQQCTGYWTKQHQCTGYWTKQQQQSCNLTIIVNEYWSFTKKVSELSKNYKYVGNRAITLKILIFSVIYTLVGKP